MNKLDFWISQAVKPKKTVFLAISTHFTPGYWWILTKIWFFKLFIFNYIKVQEEDIGWASFKKETLSFTSLGMHVGIFDIYIYIYSLAKIAFNSHKT